MCEQNESVKETVNVIRNRVSFKMALISAYRGVILGVGIYNFYRALEKGNYKQMLFGIWGVLYSTLGPKAIKYGWECIEFTRMGNYLDSIVMQKLPFIKELIKDP